MIRVLLMPSSDYLGHPFPQRHNHLFERLHDRKNFEVHVLRFNIFRKTRLSSKCIIHEFSHELKTNKTAIYYVLNSLTHMHNIIRLIKQESIDVVVAGNLLPTLLCQLAKRLQQNKIPLIFDLQDYYPTSAAGYISNINSISGTITKGFFEKITRLIIRKADAVTVPGIALAKYAKKIGNKKVYIIPNGISEHFFTLHDGKNIRKRLGFNDDIVVGYIGSIEFWLDLKPLISGIAKAHNNGIPVKLLLIGKQLQTRYPEKVKKWIKSYRIEKITVWLDFIPYEKVPENIAAIDIGTIPFNVNNPTAYYASPNKMWEYLSQGKFVISTPIPEALINRDIIFLAKNEKEYQKNIRTLFYEKSRHQNKALKGRQIALKKTWNKSVKKITNLILNLTK